MGAQSAPSALPIVVLSALLGLAAWGLSRRAPLPEQRPPTNPDQVLRVAVDLPSQGTLHLAVIGGALVAEMDESTKISAPGSVALTVGSHEVVLRTMDGSVVGDFTLSMRPGEEQRCLFELRGDALIRLEDPSKNPCRISPKP